MRKIWLVLKNEAINTITSRSFLFTTFGLPLIAGLIFLVAGALNQNVGDIQSIGRLLGTTEEDQFIEGYVDQSGLIAALPAEVSGARLRSFADEAHARQALEAGEINAYYLIPGDFLQTGDMIYIHPDFSPFAVFERSSLIERVIAVNLLAGDEQLASQIERPFRLELTPLRVEAQRDEDNPLTFLVPYSATLMYYVVILMSASLLLNSLTKEKENRVIEVLVVSLSPRQLLVGKILGLGLMGLLQTALWLGTSYSLLRISGRVFALPFVFQLPPSFLAWGVVFFILGYALYASLMAGVGALVPRLREASQATFVIILPLLIPLMMVGVLIEDPHGMLAQGLSLFPLTAPVVMITRLAAGGVALWQVLLSVALLVVAVALVLRAVAGLFRAQTLLSGKPFSLGRFFAALGGRLDG